MKKSCSFSCVYNLVVRWLRRVEEFYGVKCLVTGDSATDNKKPKPNLEANPK
jgi:hypothetical protein